MFADVSDDADVLYNDVYLINDFDRRCLLMYLMTLMFYNDVLFNGMI